MLLDQVCGERGHFTAEELDEVLHPGSVYAAPTTLVSMENTHNFAGGTVADAALMRVAIAAAHDAGVPENQLAHGHFSQVKERTLCRYGILDATQCPVREVLVTQEASDESGG